MDTVFLHVDLDAFFASVEQLDNPQYKGKAVIVGGLPENRRGVVSTASYEARKYGVHSAMPIQKALELCPNGIYLKPRMTRYHEKSEEVMNIFRAYAPKIQQLSIDEAILDFTGTEKLYGNPVIIAKKIKQEIKEKTGLTVSMGLSSVRYIAKIASGLSKPNGFYVVPRGKEKDFMLSLPLEKLWGVGPKTLQKLKLSGFNTTFDIYKRSLSLLQTIFGKAMGQFLYNAVRGLEDENLKPREGVKSISNEETFEYDIFDIYAINTKLMELSQEVMYRLYKEKLSGKTVTIKVRYDDFSTFTVQRTLEHNINNASELYESAKKLFDTKYQHGRGIRLLGVGVQKVDTDTMYQKDLFDDSSEKKRKIEKAIMELKQKDPSIKIKLARLLTFLLSLILLIKPLNRTYADTTEIEASGAGSINISKTTPLLPFEGPATSIFNYRIKDKEIEFVASGYWASSLTASITATNNEGNSSTISTDGPTFTQEVDLSLWLLINKHWYFEANAADGFNKNTIAAGYYGNGYLKHARLSNRNITFPDYYSLSLFNKNIGGGNNEAPGFLMHFEGDNWKADTVLRYDMIEAKSKTYYGNKSVSSNQIDISNYVTGLQYVLPTESLIENVKDIYVEKSSGNYKADNRKFRKLSTSEYQLIPSRYEIVLSATAKAEKTSDGLPKILITFSDMTQSQIATALGSWNDEESFLGKIQALFDCDMKNFSYDFFTSINGENALIIQSPAGFSPFTISNRYETSTQQISEASVISSSTQTESNEYTTAIVDEDITFVSEDYTNSNTEYIEIYQKNLIENGSTSSYLNPAIRYPVANLSPGYYLGYSTSDDLVIEAMTYTSTNRYDIGTNAIAGTVSVYVNNVLDYNAIYDSDNGEVTPSVTISSYDKIYITWYEDSGNYETGSIRAAAGFLWNITENFSTDISAAFTWSNNSSESYDNASTSSPGGVTIANSIGWKTESLNIKNAIAFSVEKENTSGYYRILGMDSSTPTTIYLKSSAAIDLPDDLEPCINDRPTALTTTSLSLPANLDTKLNGSVDAESGITDSDISGYAAIIKWDFSNIETEASTSSPYWAAKTLYIGNESSTMASANTFSLALKASDTNSTDYEVYLQLGVNTSDSFDAEETTTVPTWLISTNSSTLPEDVTRAFNPSISGWQTVTVRLTKEDLSHLGVYSGIRIIIAKTDKTSASSGKIYAGPVEIACPAFNIETSSDIQAYTREDSISSISSEWNCSIPTLSDDVINRFNSSTNNVEGLKWKSDNSLTSSTITLQRYIAEMDFSSYKYLSFYYYLPQALSTDDEAIKIVFDRNENGSNTETAIAFSISSTALENYGYEKWHKISLDLENKKLYIDEDSLETNDYTIDTIDSDIIPVRLTVTINVTSIEEGYFFIDEYYFSENDFQYSLQDILTASYKKDGVILQVGDKNLLEDFKIETTATSDLAGTAASEITIFGLKTCTNISHQADSDYMISAKGYSISSKTPILKTIYITDTFQKDNIAKTTNKEDSIKLDFEKTGLPLLIETKTAVTTTEYTSTQNSNANITYSSKNISIDIDSSLYQKIYSKTESTSYKDISLMEIDRGKEDARKRKVESKAQVLITLPFSYKYLSSVKPNLTTQISSIYKSTTATTNTDNIAMTYSLPFSIATNRFSLNYKRESGGVVQNTKGGNYTRDYNSIFSPNYSYIFSSPFITDLYDSSLGETILNKSKKNADIDSLYYYSSYSLSYSHPIQSNIYDFLLPRTTSISFSRNIRVSSSLSDNYQTKASMSYSAYNIFGSYSALGFFKWYTQDEYITSLSSGIKIPRTSPEDYTMLFSAYSQSAFYLNSFDVIKFAVEGNFEDKTNWSGKCTFLYKRKGENTMLFALASFFKPNIKNMSQNIIRTDSLNISFSSATSSSTTNATTVITQNFLYTHLVELTLAKYITLSSSIAPEITNTIDSELIFSITASLSLKLSF